MVDLSALERELGSLDGRLRFDLPARTALAKDAGGLVSKLPGVVLEPRSVDDVVRAVRLYLFDILTSGHQPGSTPEYRSHMLARNQALLARVRAHRGTRYHIAAVPLTRALWAESLGNEHGSFLEQKQIHDPSDILGSLE